jgi:hypothetical protein
MHVEFNTNWPNTNISGYAMVYDNGVYRGWHLTLGSFNGKVDAMIPPTQGFWITSLGTGANITIPATERIYGSQPFYKDEIVVDNMLRMKLSGNGYEDESIILFREDCSSGFDGFYDLDKWENTAAAPQFYNLTTMGSLSVNAVSNKVLNPTYNETVSFPMGLEVGANGSYTFEAGGLENFQTGVQVYLVDNMTDMIQSLNKKQDYTFVASTDDPVNRFTIVFHTGINSPITDGEAGVQVFGYEKAVNIFSDGFELKGSEIIIYDILGQIIYKGQAESSTHEVINLDVKEGYYFVQILNADLKKTEKVFIR